MKRIIIVISLVLINAIAFANASFDKTINFQYNNGQAYVGEVLYTLPLTNSCLEDDPIFKVKGYHWFVDHSFNDDTDCENDMFKNYKFDASHPLDGKPYTHKRHIEEHRFYVDKAVLRKGHDSTWILYLTDLDTGDKLKYIYHAFDILSGNDVSVVNFPFIVEKHFDWCKSLIGTKLVFATNPTKFITEGLPYDRTFLNDSNTGEKINYNDVYAKWTITGVEIDKYRMEICFIVTNGKNITKVPFNNQYSATRPNHNIGNRVFTESQWNSLVQKYGEQHMRLIMNTEMSDDMTLEEKYMAGGRKYAKEPNKIEQFFKIDTHTTTGSKEDIKEAAKIIGNGFKSSTKQIVSDAKTIFSTLVK